MSLPLLSHPQMGLTKFYPRWTAAQWGNAYNMLLLSPLTELSYVSYFSFLWYKGILWRYAPDVVSCQYLSYWFQNVSGVTGYKPFFFPQARVAKWQARGTSYRKRQRVGGLHNIRSLTPQRISNVRPTLRKYVKSGYVLHTLFRDSLREFLNGQLRMRTPLYPLKDMKTTITEPSTIRNLKFRKRKFPTSTLWMRRKSFLRVLLTLSKKVKVHLHHSIGMDEFYKFFRGTTRTLPTTKRRRHLLPRQLIWLNSPLKVNYSYHRAAKTTLFRRSVFNYHRNFKKRNLKLFNTLERDRPFKRGWTSRYLGRRLRKIAPSTLNVLPLVKFRYTTTLSINLGLAPRKVLRRIRRAFAKRHRLAWAATIWSTSRVGSSRVKRHMDFITRRQLYRWRRNARRDQVGSGPRTLKRRVLKRSLRKVLSFYRRRSLRRHKAATFLEKSGNFSYPNVEEYSPRVLSADLSSTVLVNWESSQTPIIDALEELTSGSEATPWVKTFISRTKRLPQLYHSTPRLSRTLTLRSLPYFGFLKKGVRARRWDVSRRATSRDWGLRLGGKFRAQTRRISYYYGSYIFALRNIRNHLSLVGGRTRARRYLKTHFRTWYTRVVRKNFSLQTLMRRKSKIRRKYTFVFKVSLRRLTPSRWLMHRLNRVVSRRRIWRSRKLKPSFKSHNRRLRTYARRSELAVGGNFRQESLLTFLTPVYRHVYLRYSHLVQTLLSNLTPVDSNQYFNRTRGVWVAKPRWYTTAKYYSFSSRAKVFGSTLMTTCSSWVRRCNATTTGWAKKLGVQALVLLLHVPGRSVMQLTRRVRRELGWVQKSQRVISTFTRLSSRLLLKALPLGPQVLSQSYYLYSKYRAPFILSNCGFLFIDSMNKMSKTDNTTGILQARIWKFRLSFFYKNEIKRFYLQRPGRLQILNLFQNSTRGYHFPRFGFSIFRFRHFALGTPTRWPSEGGVQSQDLNESHRKAFIEYQTNDYLFEEQSLYEYKGELHIKRIRFKPGYSRIWRRAREALNYSLQYNFRYQHRLTRVLAKLRWSRSASSFYFRELVLIRLVQNSRFVYDRHSSRLLILEGLIYLNGCLAMNPDVRIFVGDIVQVVISLNYYIIYRWLTNWYFQHTLKLTKYIQYRSNKSRYDLSKQKSSKYPDWLFRSIGRHSDIPKYLEVDFFTLSSFMIYDPIQSLDQSFVTLLENRERIYDMYNWKFIN